ncbi:MAG: hypothetical protein FWD17_00890 [Polyangiaceae bacterium]|nr:hypothetical protein [Polyangiaceae bacterium]
MSQNVEQSRATNGHETQAPEGRQTQSLGDQAQCFTRRPAVRAAIGGAAVAAILFNIPEAILGALAGVTIYAFRQHGENGKGEAPKRHADDHSGY